MSNEDTYTKARGRLEEIVQQVRSKDVPLEKSLDLYEEALQLAGRCAELIDRTDFSTEELDAAAEALTDAETEALTDDETEAATDAETEALTDDAAEALTDDEAALDAESDFGDAADTGGGTSGVTRD